MNNSTVAKNGFKTFLITLSITLVVFSFVYYLATDSTSVTGIEEVEESVSVQPAEPAQESEAFVTDTEEKGPFAVLVQQELNEEVPVVLGSADIPETTQSTVPDTGDSTLTYMAFLSAVVFLGGIYFLITSPRKKALLLFEKEATKDF